MPVNCRLRFAALPSRAIPRVTAGSSVACWADFTDAESLAPVEVSGVTSRIWLPGGALLSPAITPVREGVGEWRVDYTPTFDDIHRIEIACTTPDTASDYRDIIVSDAAPDAGTPPTPSTLLSVNGDAGPHVVLDDTDIMVTPEGTGAIAETLRIKSRRRHSYAEDYGAIGDGITDDGPAILLALAATPSGGHVRLEPGKRYRWLTGTPSIPAHKWIVGPWESPDEVQGTDYATVPSAIIMDSALGGLVGNWNSGVRGFALIRDGVTRPTDIRTAFAARSAMTGTGIKVRGTAMTVRDMLILGFGTAVDALSVERIMLDRVGADCTNGLRIDECHDIAEVRKFHNWPFIRAHQGWGLTSYTASAVADAGGFLRLTIGAHPFLVADKVNLNITNARRRVAIVAVDATTITVNLAFSGSYGTGTVWPAVYYTDGKGFHVTNSEACCYSACFSYGHEIGYHLGDGAGWQEFSNCSYDNYLSAAVDECVAIQCDGTSYGSQWLGGITSSCGTAVKINSTGAGGHLFTGMKLQSYSGALRMIDIPNGRASFVNCSTPGSGTIDIGAGADRVKFAACEFEASTLSSAAAAGIVTADTATGFLNRPATRGTLGRLRLGSTTGIENTPLVIDGVGADVSQGSQIEWGSGTKAYERVVPTGTWQLLTAAYALMAQITQGGQIRAPGGLLSDLGLTVLANGATITGITNLAGSVNVTAGGAVTIGAATAGGGPLTTLHLRGSPDGDPARGGELQLTNPTAAKSWYVRPNSSGTLQILDDGYIPMLELTVAGALRLGVPGTSVEWREGLGSPEGVVSAPVGSYYSRRDGGAGTTWYVKETGSTGNTGWSAK